MNRETKYPWVVVGLLWMVALLNYLDRQMLSTLRPTMQADIPELQSAAWFGYLMAIFLWVYGLMSPLSGIIADRVNRKMLIVASLFVWSGVVLAMGYATTFRQLYWLRGVMGVSEALYLPAGLSLIADYHPSRTRSLAVGVHMTGLYLGQALGGFGATIAARWSWQSTFHVFGLIGIAYAGILLLFLRAPPRSGTPRRHRSLAGLGTLLTTPSFWVILFYFAVISLPGWAAKNWLPTLFASNLHLTMSAAGPLATITIAAASFAGVISGGILSDRWVQTNVRGRVYVCAIGLGLTIPSLLLLGYGHSLVTVIAAAVGFGFGFGMIDAGNMPILCQFVAPYQRATGYGLMNMTGVFAGAFITDWLGKSTDAGHLGRDFSLLATVVLLAMILQLYFLKPATNDLKDELI
ncbi:MAG TPA: MFS transporter [Puia sp.]|nr:MFS transporter [Puia sp.]